MTLPGADLLLVAATALHAGFQLVVTVLVYPALAAVLPGRWSQEHAQHSRRITPLVGLVYGAVLLAGALVVAAGPSAAQVAALLASGGALLVTAGVAAPLHSRLTTGPDPALLRRLLAADRARTVLALAATLLALAGT